MVNYLGTATVAGYVTDSKGDRVTQTETLGISLSAAIDSNGNGSGIETVYGTYTSHYYPAGRAAYSRGGTVSGSVPITITNDTFLVVQDELIGVGNLSVGITLSGTVSPGGAIVTERYFANFATVIAGYSIDAAIYGTGVLDRQVGSIQLHAGTPWTTTITDLGNDQVFVGLTLNDPNGVADTASVALSNPANGTLGSTVGGTFDAATGVFTVSGSANYVSTVLDYLLFTPAFHQVATGGTVNTGISLSVADAWGATATASTSIVTTATVGPMWIYGERAGVGTTTDRGGPVPVQAGALSDPNPNVEITAQITVSDPSNGTLGNLGIGSYDAATDVYTVEGTLAAVNQALSDLTFTPTPGQVAIGGTVTTTFTLSAWDSLGANAGYVVTLAAVGVGPYQTLAAGTGDASIGSSFEYDGILLDANGNLIGVGGDYYSDPHILELVNSGGVYSPAPVDIGDFSQNQGAPGDLIADPAGDLFGVLWVSDSSASTEIFEIPRTASGYGTLTVLAAANEGFPNNIVLDSAGNLFGVGQYGVFEVANATNPGTHTIKPVDTRTVVPNIVSDDIAIGSSNDLFLVGSFELNGFPSRQLIELTETNGTYEAAPTVLYSPASYTDFTPEWVVDGPNGNLFMIGGNDGSSSIDELTATDGTFATAPIAIGGTFSGTMQPLAPLTFDSAGDIFGVGSDSSVFEIANTATGYSNTVTILTRMADAALPQLAIDSAGNLFGATDNGLIYEIAGVASPAGAVTCFLRGTRIATPAGERSIESLVAGDQVLTAAGLSRSIVWIGHRAVDCRRHGNPERVWPVRVAAHAFGLDRPRRDLFLSPDHAIFTDGILIPVRLLVNETTIARHPVPVAAYFHIELATHDVLLADGLPTESFLDWSGEARLDYTGQTMRLRPDLAGFSWEAEGCAPLVVTGAALEAVRARLRHGAAIAA